MQTATFGAGCFWGVEHFFREVNGVLDAQCGYMGGDTENPTYKEVKTGTTNHAEVVQISYDERIVTFEALLAVFWANHDPTTLNRQGEDEGTQYRSVVFYHNEQQKLQTLASIEAQQQNNKRFKVKTIVTQVLPAASFYRAEEYHQQYFAKNNLPSCHISFE